MPLYEHRDAEGNVVERVQPIEGSREDLRLAASSNWALVETAAGSKSAASSSAQTEPVSARSPATSAAATRSGTRAGKRT